MAVNEKPLVVVIQNSGYVVEVTEVIRGEADIFFLDWSEFDPDQEFGDATEVIDNIDEKLRQIGELGAVNLTSPGFVGFKEVIDGLYEWREVWRSRIEDEDVRIEYILDITQLTELGLPVPEALQP